MFNLNPFNRTPFNRSITLETFFSVYIESASEFTGILNGEFPVAVIIDTSTEFSSEMIREMPYAAEIDTASELLAEMIRERLMSAMVIDTATEISVTLTHSHVDEIRFLGDFKPGDKLMIDTRKMTVTLNGQNAIHLLDGDFFELVLGTNKLTYSDGEGTRNILTRITHRDKFLY